MKNNNLFLNIDNISVFIVLVVISIGNLIVAINQQLRKNGKAYLDKDTENTIVFIIKIVFLLVTIYFVINTYESIIESKQRQINNKFIKSQERQLFVAVFTLIGAIINLTVLNIDVTDLFE